MKKQFGVLATSFFLLEAFKKEAQKPALHKAAVSGSAIPLRLQRSRKHKQVSPNGLPIVYVGRIKTN